MKKLSEYQLKILNKMKDGLIVESIEEPIFKVWFKHKDKKEETIKKNTIRKLFKNGYIKKLKDTSEYFSYELTDKKF